MSKLNIVIVGLGRVGTGFLYGMLAQQAVGIEIIAVVENKKTTGAKVAKKAGIKHMTIEEIVSLGKKVDIIFDLSGNIETRKLFRELLGASNNDHTVLMPEIVAQLIWSLITNKPLPDVHNQKGY